MSHAAPSAGLQYQPALPLRNGLWYSIAHDMKLTSDFVAQVKDNIEAVYGRWK